MKSISVTWSAAALFGLMACSGCKQEAGPGAATPVAPSAAPVAAPAAPSVAAPPSAPTPVLPTRAGADAESELREQIQRLVGAARCRDVSHCRALPMGSKPCGGPESYLAWSVLETDGARLEALAQRYAQARQERNQRSGLMSDCAILPEPTLRCVVSEGSEGRCQTVPTRGGSPSLVTR